MQINHRIILALWMMGILFLSACSVSKHSVARYKTMTQRAQVTMLLDQHQYTLTCTMRTWHDELIVLSVQPMLGIEMVRIEATQDSIWVFDKMNRRYAAIDYASINRIIQPNISYRMLQDFCNMPITPKKEKAEMQFSSGKHRLSLSCKYSNREFNTLQAPTQTKTNKYKQVDLRTILPL